MTATRHDVVCIVEWEMKGCNDNPHFCIHPSWTRQTHRAQHYFSKLKISRIFNFLKIFLALVLCWVYSSRLSSAKNAINLNKRRDFLVDNFCTNAATMFEQKFAAAVVLSARKNNNTRCVRRRKTTHSRRSDRELQSPFAIIVDVDFVVDSVVFFFGATKSKKNEKIIISKHQSRERSTKPTRRARMFLKKPSRAGKNSSFNTI